MKIKYNGYPILRTPLIVAGNNDKYINKAFESDCDAIVLDLEDGVPEKFKQKARENIYSILDKKEQSKKPIFVRVNSYDTGLLNDDINGVAHENLDGFLYTKPYKSDDIVRFDELLSEKESNLNLPNGYFKVIVIIETPESVLNAKEIAFSSDRIIGLLFGAEDLLGDMQGIHSSDGRSLNFGRSQVLMACRAANIIPIDTPYIQVHNYEGLREFIKPAFELGYEGMLLISPSQAEIVKDSYTPNIKDVENAYEMYKISKSNDSEGVGVSIKGKLFISPPTLKRATNLIKRYEAIQKFEQFLNG